MKYLQLGQDMLLKERLIDRTALELPLTAVRLLLFLGKVHRANPPSGEAAGFKALHKWPKWFKTTS